MRSQRLHRTKYLGISLSLIGSILSSSTMTLDNYHIVSMMWAAADMYDNSNSSYSRSGSSISMVLKGRSSRRHGM
ncbi:hypothetical protein BC826DRAFT_990070 [Russula brevipes]|nr:hypothetical protein BC826DRAFT_990070 [Russula brevipes]